MIDHEELVDRVIKAYLNKGYIRRADRPQPNRSDCDVYWTKKRTESAYVVLNNVNGPLATYQYYPATDRLKRVDSALTAVKLGSDFGSLPLDSFVSR